MRITFPKNRTPTSDMFYVKYDEQEYMIYEDQDKAAQGQIYVYPVPKESDDPNIRFINEKPHYNKKEEIFMAWFSFFYLQPEIEPPNQEILNKYQEFASRDIN